MTRAESVPQAQCEMVGGVPVFFVEVPGPVRAALVFRVGSSDEDIPRRGVTHLVEHMSLAAQGQPSFEFNGMVDETKTTFFCSGTQEQVVEFLHALCRSLGQLPLDRLESERRILRVEGESRGRSTVDLLRTWRFGTTGPGAASYDEFALRGITPEQVREWTARWFTSGNAALWMTCAPPSDLVLSLPAGDRRPVRHPTMLSFAGPGYVSGSSGGLAASMIVPRRIDSAALEYVLQRRLFARLRMQEAVSYSINVQRRAIDDQVNELFILVDGLPDSQSQLEQGVLDVLNDLAQSGCTEDELSEWRTQYMRPLAEPGGVAGLLHFMVTDYLYGQPAKRPEHLVHEAAGVTSESVRQVVASSYSGIVFCIPEGSTVIANQAKPLPEWAMTAVPGRRFRSTNPDSAAALFIGDLGISYVLDAERRATVLWDQCAAVLRWDDGGRRILGKDGTWLDLPPQAWREFATARHEIDSHTRSDLVVNMGTPPNRPPVPLPRAKFLGSSSTGLIGTLAGPLALSGLLVATEGLVPFLVFGLPCLLGAVLCLREIYLRRKGIHGSGAGLAARPSRPMRHLPRRTLLLTLALSVTFIVGLGAASSSGANVGPLPILFGVTGITALRELLRRPQQRN